MKLSARILMALLLALCLVLTGCGSEKAEAPAPGGASETAKQPEFKKVEIAEHIKNAMAASDLLTNVNTALIPGEGIVTCDNGPYDYLPLYSMYDLKKLVTSASASTVLAINNSNELYFRNIKVAENVEHLVYATNNMNEEGWYTTADGSLYCIYKDFDTNAINTYLMAEGTAPINAMGVEKHDLFIVRADGLIYANGSEEHWGKCAEFKNWGADIAVIAASKVMNEEDRGVADYATVAAITGDGRTLAVGDFADDILAMGELSYISMSDGVIVGLKTDGTLAVAGPYAQLLTDAGVTSLNDIAGVRVSGEFVSAVDKNGVYYFYDIELFRDYCSDVYAISVNGAQNENTAAHIYTGSYHYTSAYGEQWRKVAFGEYWGDDDAETRPAGSTVALRTGSTIEYPLTEEYVKAYLDQLFADKTAELEADGYNWFAVYITENGYLQRIQITTEGFFYGDEISVDFFSYVARTIAASDLIGLTPAALEQLAEYDFTEYGDPFKADGFTIERSGSPYGEVIDISF